VVYPPGDCSRNNPESNSRRKDTPTMPKDNVIDFKKPESLVHDPITEVVPQRTARSSGLFPEATSWKFSQTSKIC
jgi:hypothetical protein